MRIEARNTGLDSVFSVVSGARYFPPAMGSGCPSSRIYFHMAIRFSLLYGLMSLSRRFQRGRNDHTKTVAGLLERGETFHPRWPSEDLFPARADEKKPRRRVAFAARCFAPVVRRLEAVTQLGSDRVTVVFKIYFV